MNAPTWLHNLKLTPVIELGPWRFSNIRPLPDASGMDDPGAWQRYWSDALAGAGVTELCQIRPGTWHVATSEFKVPDKLAKVLNILFADQGEPLQTESNLVLDGGLALSDANGRILLEPQCCSDLHNHRDWRSATQCQNPDWQMLWIGHPWISVRQESARLLLSDLHESDAPVAKWIVEPLELECALDVAVAELHRFAKSLAEALLLLGVTDKADVMAESLAGLD